MKTWAALLFCFYLFAGDDDKKSTYYSRQNDLTRERLKGNVRSEETRESNKATFVNDKWIISDTGVTSTIFTYDKKGYIATTADFLRGEKTMESTGWKDEDGLHNWLITDKDNPGKTELAIREFNEEGILVIKTFKTDEDTITYDQLEEELRTYTDFGYRRECFAVKNGNKQRYLYCEKHFLSPDTFSINYYGESSARLTHAVLERDGAGNPTKILVYSETDTTLTLKKYSYY